MAEYRRGSGPNALPQGAATGLNAATPDPEAQMLTENQHIPVQYAPQHDVIPNDNSGLDENQDIMLDHPDPNYQPSLMTQNRPGKVPTYVVRHMPELLAATADPSAPPTLIALKRSIVRHLENELREGD